MAGAGEHTTSSPLVRLDIGALEPVAPNQIRWRAAVLAVWLLAQNNKWLARNNKLRRIVAVMG